MIVGGVSVLAGVAYYLYYARSQQQQEDVKQKAKELEHAARVQSERKIDEGKEKYADAKVRKRIPCFRAFIR